MSEHTPTAPSETAGAALLVGAATIALIWANSPWHDVYTDLWHLHPGLGLDLDLHHVVNDGLMAIFFLAIGVEIKRELVSGELRDPKTAALPAVAAIGGMVVPAAIFALVTAGSAGSVGWGIPMATDIAFALGVLGLLGSRVPPQLRLFLLTLAVVDDLGAIAVIAIFYSSTIAAVPLAGAVAVAGVIWAAHRLGVSSPWVHGLLFVGLWVLTYRSGVHATIAGVVAGLLAPVRSSGRTIGVAERWEHALAPFVGFIVVPVFALANAGVALSASSFGEGATVRVALGVVGGLVVGKVVGVSGAAWLAVRTGLGTMPAGLGWRHVLGVGALAGIGFTVSLFVADLAFSDAAALADGAKVAVLAASVLSASLGAVALSAVHRR